MSPHFFIPPFEGGCEGLAMLNRTNRTLSANLNRLNLGTRSLATQADVNNGDQTLRIRHAHRVVMRDGMTGFPPSPISISGGVIPVISGSPAVSPWLVESCVVRPRVELAVETCSVSGRPCRSGESQEPSPERSLPRQRRSKANRKPFTGKRLYPGTGFGDASTRASLATAAAWYAASGG